MEGLLEISWGEDKKQDEAVVKQNITEIIIPENTTLHIYWQNLLQS